VSETKDDTYIEIINMGENSRREGEIEFKGKD
jgi:hypothetical protein